jgi:hypothetical protein
MRSWPDFATLITSRPIQRLGVVFRLVRRTLLREFTRQGPAEGMKRVLRGGGFNHPAFFLRCAERGSDVQSCRSSHIGFRVVREVVPNAAAPALTARAGS